MHKPLHSLVFVIAVFSLLAFMCLVFPVNGIAVGDRWKIQFPNLTSVFSTAHHSKDISAIIRAANEADSIGSDSSAMSRVLKEPAKKVLLTGLQYSNKAALVNFFDALHLLKKDPTSIRVLHYGDSQIEGDRITDYLRMKLQGQFGGEGPGLMSLMPISPTMTNRLTCSNNFDRYNVFIMKDKRVQHTNYGVFGGFTRFIPYRRIFDTTSIVSAEVGISTTKLGGINSTKYKKVKLFYGGAAAKTWCEFYDGPALSGADSLLAGGYFNVKEYNVGLGSLTHTLKFKGKDSPDLYALSLESETGVLVDNIAQRGSSGTFWHLVNFAQLKQFYDYLRVKCIIMEFGGNALPSIKDATMAVNYAGYIRAQISIIKKLAPGASIIFIGPADMSVKEGTEYRTHPQLENTRDALKKVVLESGCAFFDMYDCMGGENSMMSWVEQDLAATDYIHFSPQGARKMATLFYAALINEYNTYTKNRK